MAVEDTLGQRLTLSSDLQLGCAWGLVSTVASSLRLRLLEFAALAAKWRGRSPVATSTHSLAGWIRSYWDKEELTFVGEVGDDEWITRHVEVDGGRPSLVGWVVGCCVGFGW